MIHLFGKGRRDIDLSNKFESTYEAIKYLKKYDYAKFRIICDEVQEEEIKKEVNNVIFEKILYDFRKMDS